MDRQQFRQRLEGLDPDDRAGLVEAIRERVSALSGRHLDIQSEIRESDDRRRDLQERLQEVEAEIVAQADASVEADVETIDDVEALPSDAEVAFDPELVEEVERIQSEAKNNYHETADRGSDLQAELNESTEELELYGDLLASVEAEELSAAEARDRLLDHVGESSRED